MEDKTRRRRDVYLPPALHAKMLERKAASHLDLAGQMHTALEVALSQQKAGERIVWSAAVPKKDEDWERFIFLAEDGFWHAVKKAASENGQIVRSFAVTALLRYFDDLEADGGHHGPKTKPVPPLPSDGAAKDNSNSNNAIREVVREEVRLELQRTRSLPEQKEVELLRELGEWSRPQGSEYLMSGQVNAGPLRELSDLPESEFFSDFEILEWEDERDLMLRITEDARDGECLIYDDIFPGDILHFRCGLRPENGEIVVAVGYDMQGRAFGTVKHYFETKTGIELRPNNPQCEAICAFPGDIEVRGVLFNVIQRNYRARMQTRRRMGIGQRYDYHGGD